MTDFTQLPKEQWDRVTTRDGRKPRILCTDGLEEWPIVFLTEDSLATCHKDGRVYESGEHGLDLILPPEPRVVWLREWAEGADWQRYVVDYRPLPKTDFAHTDYRIALGEEPKIERCE